MNAASEVIITNGFGPFVGMHLQHGGKNRGAFEDNINLGSFESATKILCFGHFGNARVQRQASKTFDVEHFSECIC